MLFANQTLTGFALDVLIRNHPNYVSNAWDELTTALAAEQITPTADMLEGLSSARGAHERLSAESHEGKLCIKIK